MVFLSNNPKGLIHIHNLVENHLEVHLMEDCHEKDHLIQTCLKDYHQIHLLDFMDDKHLIQGYLCHHGTNRFQFNLNQPINCHIESFNIPHMWRILILMVTLKFSRRQLEKMVKLWRHISSTYLVLLYKTTS